MSDEPTANEPEEDDDAETEEPRSIFSALWFRAVLGVAMVGVIAAVAVPYVLERTRLAPAVPKSATTARVTPSPAVPLPAARPPAPPVPSTPAPSSSTTSPGPASPGTTPAPVASAIVTERKSGPPVTPVPGPASAAPRPKRELAAASALASAATSPADKGSPAAKSARADEAKPLTAKRPVARNTMPREERPQAAAAPVMSPGEASGGSYWVQVGAYRDGGTAKRVAARLRDEGYQVIELAPVVRESTPAAASPPSGATSDRYDVVVSGPSGAALDERLSAKGLAGEAAGSSVVVKPPLPLADAIALSKDLAADGLKVQVRRTGPPAPAAPKPSASGAIPPEELYRVRVGAYPDHAAAVAAARELAAGGHPGFVGRSAP